MKKLIDEDRTSWIDCTKLIAICAVLIDHCYRILYTDQKIAMASYFSVSLFVMLSGITAWKSYAKSRQTFLWRNDAKKAVKLFLSYAVAVAVYQIYETRFFSVKLYISNVFSFSYSAHFYFVLFFLQLVLVSSGLIAWLNFCRSKKYSIVWHLATLGILCVVCAILINKTDILPVHGGGRYILGGTYILLYYLGMLIASGNIFHQQGNARLITLVVSAISLIVWLYCFVEFKLPFDNLLQDYWGGGFNPPSVNLIVLAVIILLFCFSFFSLLDETDNQFINKLIKLISHFGRRTWYIFLYHFLVRTILIDFEIFTTDSMLCKVTFFATMIILPSIGVSAAQCVKKEAKSFMSKYYG